ncbi:MAG: Eco57I restriction-modification methylase domain-containing protein [bacterium]|nr:Eco57I restriction-modification methylase domain-containing protein [bacterium]
MAEAAEIAKLRLFLKLAAQLDDPARIEPLPDLDFNIKSGNLLVGIADAADIERRFSDRGVLPFGLDLAMDAAESVAAAYDDFVAAQAAETGTEGEQHAKSLLQAKIKAISGQVDAALYEMRNESQDFEEWRKSHQPFHWFAEFPAVWRNGGFDAIIGNPPYIRGGNLNSVKKRYTWQGFTAESCPDIYAVCTERASSLLNSQGRFAMVVMHSLCFHKGYTALRVYLLARFNSIWVPSYSVIPGCLFSGSARVRNTIVIAASEGKREVFTGRCRRWVTSAREHLFATQQMAKPHKVILECTENLQWPFIDDELLVDALAKMMSHQQPISQVLVKEGKHKLGFKTTAGYVLGIFDIEPPIIDPNTELPVSTMTNKTAWFNFQDSIHRDIAILALSGRWGHLWWNTFGDGFDVTRGVLAALPCDIERLATAKELSLVPCDMELISLVADFLKLANDLKNELPNQLVWKNHAGVKVGRYDLWQCRHITDEADWLLAQAWGLTWEQYEAAGNLRDRMTFGNRE